MQPLRFAILLLACAAIAAVPNAAAAAKTIPLETHGEHADAHFTLASETAKNPQLTADPLDAITVNLTNKDGVQHNFVVQGIDGSKAPASGFLETENASAVVTFTVPATEAGKTLTYLCEVHPTIMKGDFVVSGTTGGGNGTPGFETLGLLAAAGVAVAIVAFRARK